MNTRLSVKNLPATISERELTEMFSAYGNVIGVHIRPDPDDVRAPGFGFVTMMTPEGALVAVQSLDGQVTASGRLTVSLSTAPNPSPGHSPRRFVSHLF